MGSGTKVCQQCQKTIASAKKVCDCGHVFLEKKKRGFQETPVVITSDRLRPGRSHDTDCRPVRVKKHKYHGSDFIYSPSKRSENTRINNEPHGTENERSSKVDGKLVDKLYPKRDRMKTSKYEDFYYKQNRKIVIANSSERQPDPCSSKEFLHQPKPAKEIDIRKTENQDVRSQAAVTNEAVVKVEGNTGKDQTQYPNTNEDGGISIRRNEVENPTFSVKPSNSIEHVGNIRVNAEVGDLTYIKQLLLTDLSMEIDIIADNDTILSLPRVEDEYLSSDSSGSFIEDDRVRLKRIRLPARLRNQVVWSKRKSPEVDDIPLSKLVRAGGYTGPFHINKHGQLKRPVGRPRKYPLIINKPKRPVGRPRKDRSSTVQIKPRFITGQKRRGRPPSSSASAASNVKVRRQQQPSSFPIGMYTEHFFYDDEDDMDDKHDPDYKSPYKINTSLNRTDRPGRRCFLSPPQLMDRMRIEYSEMIEQEKWAKRYAKKDPALEIPEEKKELYSHILKEINRRILSQAFSCKL